MSKVFTHTELIELLEDYQDELTGKFDAVNVKIAGLVKIETRPSYRRLELCKKSKLLIMRHMQIWQYLYGKTK